MSELYDTIGLNYSNLRKPDPRIAKQIESALGDAKTVLNVGAGSGSYEPINKAVTAIDPSVEMIAQRAVSETKCIRASAEDIPFPDDSFDAAMAVLTVHHWSDKKKGMAEIRRVTKGKIVILTFDPEFEGFWLTDYFPELITLDQHQMPRLPEYENWLGPVDISAVSIPHNCTDGFQAAYWRRPQAYLDDKVRAAISSFWKIENIDHGLEALRSDLESGHWHERYGYLKDMEAMDLGYRLVQTK